MKGYFARKPENIEIVKGEFEGARREKLKPVEITVVGKVILTLDEYLDFCRDMLEYWSFLEPYADQTVFTAPGKADCVLVGAPGQHYIAVCKEGYQYARYCTWPF